MPASFCDVTNSVTYRTCAAFTGPTSHAAPAFRSKAFFDLRSWWRILLGAALEDLKLNKVVANAEEAVRDIPDGATIMLGGFGLCGIPENLIDALVTRGADGLKGLHTISNNMGVDGFGMGRMLEAGMIESHIGSYVGENRLLEEKVIRGELNLILVPQGTLAERIRAGGAGIPAFFTPTGLGTLVAEGKEVRTFEGRSYVMERWLKADFALVKAWRGDTHGNLVYRKTARNFNPMMATAAAITIAEVEELVQPGQLDPDAIATPGIYVQRIFKGSQYQKRIERRTVRTDTVTERPAT